MKAREPRQSIMVPVRIRQEAKWMDASIRNVSSRGLMLKMDDPPPKGSFIEIRRQQAVIVGQVRWSGEGRCGIRTQDTVPVAYLTSKAALQTAPRSGGGGRVERRASVRVLTAEEIAERSRWRGALFQRVAMIVAVATAGLLLASLIFNMLQKPFETVVARLG